MPRRRRDDYDDDDDESPAVPTRNRNRRRRPESSPPPPDEEAEPEPVPMWKTVAVVVVVIGCFVAVYPKMFHPMLMYVLGVSKSQSVESESEQFPHPGARHGAGPPPGRMPMPDRHMHHAPPPPMRMGPQAGPVEQPKGSSKAMWHWMLPFYTIGVIVFLLYTLGKIFWKQPRRGGDRRTYDFRYNTTRDRFELNRNAAGGGDDDDEEEDAESDEEYDDDRRNRSALSDRQLRRLQNRLQDTESAMHKILGQLEQLSGTVDQSTAENLKKMTLETLNNIGDIEQEKRGGDKRGGRRAKKSSTNDADNGAPYIKDLEKALTDFKKFTQNYIEEHTTKVTSAPGEAPDNGTPASGSVEKKKPSDDDAVGSGDENESDERAEGFDAMEDEDTENLTVEQGEGELINVESEKDIAARTKHDERIADKNRVRKRVVPKESPPVEEE